MQAPTEELLRGLEQGDVVDIQVENPDESWTETVEIARVGRENHEDDEETLVLLVETEAGDVIDLMKSNDQARLLREEDGAREYAGSVTGVRPLDE